MLMICPHPLEHEVFRIVLELGDASLESLDFLMDLYQLGVLRRQWVLARELAQEVNIFVPLSCLVLLQFVILINHRL